MAFEEFQSVLGIVIGTLIFLKFWGITDVRKLLGAFFAGLKTAFCVGIPALFLFGALDKTGGAIAGMFAATIASIGFLISFLGYRFFKRRKEVDQYYEDY